MLALQSVLALKPVCVRSAHHDLLVELRILHRDLLDEALCERQVGAVVAVDEELFLPADEALADAVVLLGGRRHRAGALQLAVEAGVGTV